MRNSKKLRFNNLFLLHNFFEQIADFNLNNNNTGSNSKRREQVQQDDWLVIALIASFSEYIKKNKC